METGDYYDVLGVKHDASQKAIKEAYRERAFQYHPDRNQGNRQASEKMKTLNEAYAVLSDSTKRREYDTLKERFGSSAYTHFRNSYSEQDIFRGSDIHDIFEEMAKNFGLRGFDDIFKENYGRGYQRFEFGRPGFFAKGFVFSGPLKKSGQQKDAFPLSGNLGKLSRFFLEKLGGVTLPQNGSHMNDVIRLSPELAQQGGPYAYLHKKKAKKLVVQIPPNVKEGKRIRLAGMGKNGKGGGQPGDLYLTVQIKKPLLGKMKHFISKLHK
jgi:DnaJ-class molecular chaperone